MAQALTAPAGGLDETVLRAAEITDGAAGIVPRPRLVRRLIDAGNVPVAMLLAPAGYGKTTLLTEWEAGDPRPFAWVSLDDSDNDPDTLLAAIALALEAVESVGWDVLEPLSSPSAGRPTAALRRLVRSLKRRELPVHPTKPGNPPGPDRVADRHYWTGGIL